MKVALMASHHRALLKGMAVEATGTALTVGLLAYAAWFAQGFGGAEPFVRAVAYSGEVGLGLWGLYLLLGASARSYFNPSIALAGWLPWRHLVPVLLAQGAGAVIGARAMAHLPVARHLEASITPSAATGLYREAFGAFVLVLFYVGIRHQSGKPMATVVAACTAVLFLFPGAVYIANPALVLAALYPSPSFIDGA